MCLYAATGDTKSTQIYHIFRYYHKKTGCKAKHIRDCPGVDKCEGKIARVINADPGQSFEAFEDSGCLEKGLVQYIDITGSKLALADTRKLALGYWPNQNEELQATEEFQTKPADWGKIGAYFVEGITSLTDMWLSHMRKNATSGGKGGGVAFQPSYFYEEGGFSFSGLQEGHYQLPQEEFRNVHNLGLRTLPIDLLVWTALVGKGIDKERGEDCFAPKGAGQADNFKIPSWFGDCLHLGRQLFKTSGDSLVEKVVAWFQNHRDGDGVKYLAKPRLAPEKFPILLEVFPQGFVPLDFKNGLFKYMWAIDMIREGKQAEEIRERLGMK